MSVNPLSPSIFETKDINTIVDNPKRLQYIKSCWQGLIHRREKRKLDQNISQAVKDLFRERYHIPDSKIFERIWNAIGSEIWTPSSALTVEKLKLIDQAFQSRLIYHGQGITAPAPLQSQTDAGIQKLVRSLLHGGSLDEDVFKKQTVQAVFVKENPGLLQDFRTEFQNELNHLAASPPKNPQEEIVWRAFLGNIIALIPYSYPPENTPINIPVLENGTCRLASYTITTLPLTLTSFSSPMTALSFTPKEGENASHLLAFLGTTYPAGSGFAATVLADFTPGHAVGEAVYKKNASLISKWFEGKNNVHVFGTSLGGALSLHTLNHHQEKIACVDVYNPPGLYSENWKGPIRKSKLNIYCQYGDLVCSMGTWPKGDNVSLYAVMPHQDGVGENIVSSHARAFTGCEKVTIIKQDPAKENKSLSRRILTFMHRALGPFAIFLPVGCALLLYKLFSVVYRVSALCIKRLKKLNQ